MFVLLNMFACFADVTSATITWNPDAVDVHTVTSHQFGRFFFSHYDLGDHIAAISDLKLPHVALAQAILKEI
jgi:hypothetical protein